MSRREPVSVSLFPFMSILACTIGALTFLLITMAVTSVGATRLIRANDSELAVIAAADRERDSIREETLRQERLEIEQAASLLRELDRALEAKGFEATAPLEETEEILAKHDERKRAARRIAKIESELTRVRAGKNRVDASIEVLRSRRETLPILIDPTDLSRDQSAYFIECESDGVTAYRVRDDFEYFVSAKTLSTSRDLRRYLNRLKAEPGALLVLLIREKGIATSRTVAALAKDSGIRVAHLPLPGAGELDFRLLRIAEGAD